MNKHTPLDLPKPNWQLLLVALLVISMMLAPQVTAALSPAQRNIYSSGALHYDQEIGAMACYGGDQLLGDTNEEKIYNFLVAAGLAAHQAAGVMGNLKAESNFDPGIEERGNGIGFGIAQWSFERRETLEQAARDQNVSVSDLGFQLRYLYEESNERRPNPRQSPYDPRPPSFYLGDHGGMSEWQGLKHQETVELATYYWEWNFERPRHIGQSIRIEYAKDILNRLGSSGGIATIGTGASCSVGTDGQVVGGVSLPVDQRWYDEFPDWFSKPHHSGYAASDIPVPTGTPVYSMIDGTIHRAPITSNNTSYGNGVWVKSANGIEIIYAHGLDGGAGDMPKEGMQVKAGQPIMHSASTGNSTGPHLHLEIRVNGQPRCPQTLFKSIVDGSPVSIPSLPASGCTY